NKGVIRRAARWDGFCGGKVHAPDEDWQLTPDEVRQLKADIQAQRGSDQPLDIALGGAARGADPEADRAMIALVAEAGATWWMEYVYPELGGPGEMRRRVAGGPLRVG